MNKILIVDDDIQNLDGVSSFLQRHKFDICVASGYAEAKIRFEENKPDIAIIDILLIDKLNNKYEPLGLKLGKDLRDSYPKTGIIFRSAYTHYLKEVLLIANNSIGGVAYIFKGGGNPNQLIDAIQITTSGGIYIDPYIKARVEKTADVLILELLSAEEREVINTILKNFVSLTKREISVINYFSKSRKGMATELSLSEKTIDRHINNIYSKLEINKTNSLNMRQDILLIKAFLIYQLQQK